MAHRTIFPRPRLPRPMLRRSLHWQIFQVLAPAAPKRADREERKAKSEPLSNKNGLVVFKLDQHGCGVPCSFFFFFLGGGFVGPKWQWRSFFGFNLVPSSSFYTKGFSNQHVSVVILFYLHQHGCGVLFSASWFCPTPNSETNTSKKTTHPV